MIHHPSPAPLPIAVVQVAGPNATHPLDFGQRICRLNRGRRRRRSRENGDCYFDERIQSLSRHPGSHINDTEPAVWGTGKWPETALPSCPVMGYRRFTSLGGIEMTSEGLDRPSLRWNP
jgi:hypothetical protein